MRKTIGNMGAASGVRVMAAVTLASMAGPFFINAVSEPRALQFGLFVLFMGVTVFAIDLLTVATKTPTRRLQTIRSKERLGLLRSFEKIGLTIFLADQVAKWVIRSLLPVSSTAQGIASFGTVSFSTEAQVHWLVGNILGITNVAHVQGVFYRVGAGIFLGLSLWAWGHWRKNISKLDSRWAIGLPILLAGLWGNAIDILLRGSITDWIALPDGFGGDPVYFHLSDLLAISGTLVMDMAVLRTLKRQARLAISKTDGIWLAIAQVIVRSFLALFCLLPAGLLVLLITFTFSALSVWLTAIRRNNVFKDVGISSDHEVGLATREEHEAYHKAGEFEDVIKAIALEIGATLRVDGKYDLRSKVRTSGGRIVLANGKGELRLEPDGALVIIHKDFKKDHAGRGEFSAYARSEVKAQHELAEVRAWGQFAIDRKLLTREELMEGVLGRRLRSWINDPTLPADRIRQRHSEAAKLADDFHQKGLEAEFQFLIGNTLDQRSQLQKSDKAAEQQRYMKEFIADLSGAQIEKIGAGPDKTTLFRIVTPNGIGVVIAIQLNSGGIPLLAVRLATDSMERADMNGPTYQIIPRPHSRAITDPLWDFIRRQHTSSSAIPDHSESWKTHVFFSFMNPFFTKQRLMTMYKSIPILRTVLNRMDINLLGFSKRNPFDYVILQPTTQFRGAGAYANGFQIATSRETLIEHPDFIQEAVVHEITHQVLKNIPDDKLVELREIFRPLREAIVKRPLYMNAGPREQDEEFITFSVQALSAGRDYVTLDGILRIPITEAMKAALVDIGVLEPSAPNVSKNLLNSYGDLDIVISSDGDSLTSLGKRPGTDTATFVHAGLQEPAVPLNPHSPLIPFLIRSRLFFRASLRFVDYVIPSFVAYKKSLSLKDSLVLLRRAQQLALEQYQKGASWDIVLLAVEDVYVNAMGDIYRSVTGDKSVDIDPPDSKAHFDRSVMENGVDGHGNYFPNEAVYIQDHPPIFGKQIRFDNERHAYFSGEGRFAPYIPQLYVGPILNIHGWTKNGRLMIGGRYANEVINEIAKEKGLSKILLSACNPFAGELGPVDIPTIYATGLVDNTETINRSSAMGYWQTSNGRPLAEIAAGSSSAQDQQALARLEGAPLLTHHPAASSDKKESASTQLYMGLPIPMNFVWPMVVGLSFGLLGNLLLSYQAGAWLAVLAMFGYYAIHQGHLSGLQGIHPSDDAPIDISQVANQEDLLRLLRRGESITVYRGHAGRLRPRQAFLAVHDKNVEPGLIVKTAEKVRQEKFPSYPSKFKSMHFSPDPQVASDYGRIGRFAIRLKKRVDVTQKVPVFWGSLERYEKILDDENDAEAYWSTPGGHRDSELFIDTDLIDVEFLGWLSPSEELAVYAKSLVVPSAVGPRRWRVYDYEKLLSNVAKDFMRGDHIFSSVSLAGIFRAAGLAYKKSLSEWSKSDSEWWQISDDRIEQLRHVSTLAAWVLLVKAIASELSNNYRLYDVWSKPERIKKIASEIVSNLFRLSLYALRDILVLSPLGVLNDPAYASAFELSAHRLGFIASLQAWDVWGALVNGLGWIFYRLGVGRFVDAISRKLSFLTDLSYHRLHRQKSVEISA